MQTRATLAAALLVVMLAACGGNSATQAPGGGGNGGGGSATAAPTDDNGGNGGGNGGNGGEPTDDNGGNGGGNGGLDTTYGGGHVDISGAASASVDLGFSPPISHFGGTDTTILYLLPANAEGALALTWSNGEFIAVFTSTEITVSGIECTTSNLNIGATTAKGSFECARNYVVLNSGASIEDVTFKGSFDVHG